MNNWTRFEKFLRRLMDKVFDRANEYFLCSLPASLGFLANWILRLLFARISTEGLDVDSIKELNKKGHIIYATKYASNFEFLLLRTKLLKAGVPVPEASFDYKIVLWQPVLKVIRTIYFYFEHLIRLKERPNPFKSGYLAREIMDGKAGFVSMVDARSFYKRFVGERVDPLKYLLYMQKEIEQPIFIVPPVVLYGKNPPKSQETVSDAMFGTEERPGLFRRWASLISFPEHAILEVSEHIDIKEFMSRPEHKHRSMEYLSYSLRQEIIDCINRHRQSVKGPALKSSQELKEMVLRNERFRNFLHDHAASKNKLDQEFHAEADACLKEIAASYDPAVISFLSTAVKWISTNMFDGVDVDMEGLKRLKAMSRNGPLILVPCHKSHIDYLVLSYILHINNMPCPLIAAGKNLSFWPMGPIFRNSGAFFIRRSFRGARLYSKVFSEYIRVLLQEGFNIEFFIEGGRSRTGKLVLPKFGLLSILLNAYREGACRDLYFAPIYIGYDRVIEESSYLHEIEGGEKKGESLSQMMKARKFLKKRYGSIFVRFHEPIRLQDVLDGFEVPFAKMTGKEQNVVCRNLGHRIIESINEVTVVTPHALVAASVLTGLKETFTENELNKCIEFFLFHLKTLGAETSDTLMEPRTAARMALDAFVNDKFILRQGRGMPKEEESKNQQFALVESRRPMLEYYKNNCMSFLVPHAFVAMSVMAGEAFQFNSSSLIGSYKFLQDFFKNEFHYDPDLAPEHYVRKTLKVFMDDAMLVPHKTLPETYNLTSAGHSKMKIFAKFLKPYFESYLVVLRVFEKNNASEMEKKERGKKFQSTGNKMYKKKEIRCPEALSKVNYENAAQYFISRGIRTLEDESEIEQYREVILNYLNYLE